MGKLLKKAGGGVLKALGLNFMKARGWVVIISLVSSVLTGAFTYGYAKAREDCIQKNAEGQVKSAEQYAENVKDASDLAIDATRSQERRAELFRNKKSEIEDKYDEQDAEGFNDCGPAFDADDLRLYNSGNEAGGS